MQGLRCALLAVAVLACACLVACGPTADVTAESPHVTDARLAASGDGTEGGQRVQVQLEFSSDVACEEGTEADFAVALNGKAVDSQVMSVSVEQAGPRSVELSLTPAEQAQAGASQKLFALYAGNIRVAPARSDGALVHVRAPGAGASAVMDEAVSGVVPTGVALRVDSSAPGDASTGAPASCTFTVIRGPALRCCTWLCLGDGDKPACYIHNHVFQRETPASCAAAFAEALNAADCGYAAVADGAEVAVAARDVVDGQLIEPRIYEGLGAETDASIAY